MPHHRARFTARGAGRLCVVSSRMERRSPRRPPGRTSRRRPCGSGSGVGERRLRPSGSRWRAWPSAPAARALARRRCRPRRRAASASCVNKRAGARAGWPMSPRSAGRIRRCTGCCSALASRAARGPSARPWSATCGRVPASCCTWTPRSWAVQRARTRRHWRPRSPLAAGRLGVRALDRRRLLPARLLRDPRRREGGRP